MTPEAMGRRQFTTGVAAAIVAGGCTTTSGPAATASSPGRATAQGGAMIAYVGCYTTAQRNARGEGIRVYRIDAGSGAWTPVQLVKDLVNPSWLGLDRARRFLYVAHGDGEQATAFAVDGATGQLRLVNQQPTGGKNGVSVAVDPSNRFLVVGNYSSGTVTVLPITADGALGPRTDLVSLPGTPGPHRAEQASSHPHDVPFDPSGRYVVVPDKALDRVFVYTLDAASGKLAAVDPPFATARPGAGPRHVAFHPGQPFAYVNNELDSTVTTYRFERGVLTPRQIITTLPPSYTGTNTTSEIAVARTGRHLYVSNRGHDSIAVFAIDDASGVLAPVTWEPTQGKTPRFFALDPAGAVLYAANQDSDTIVAFRVDARTGTLSATGQVITTGSPSSIVFL